MKHTKKWLLAAVAVVALAGAFVAGAQVRDLHAGHAHPGGPSEPSANGGKKWPTDGPLRQGMSNVRDQVQAAVPGVHGGYTPADYLALANGIEKELEGVIANCKLAPEADAQLHLVLADIYAGTASMKQEGNRMGGVVKVIGALDAYSRLFDHPGWKQVEH